VTREVQEEVGIGVTNVRYVTSQPWPFPSQLMLGFFADYAEGDIVIDPLEIAHADWYGRNDLPTIPPPQSIAGQLIQRFFDAR
jgi:NAD+ diphosphatase